MNVQLHQSESKRHTALVVLTTSVLTTAVLAFSVAFGLTSYKTTLDEAGQHARFVSGLVSSQINLFLTDVTERLEEVSLFLVTQQEAPQRNKRLNMLLESVLRGEPYVEGVQVAGPGGRVETWSGRGGYHQMNDMAFTPVQSPGDVRMWLGSPVRDPLHPDIWMFGLSLAQGEGAAAERVITVLVSLQAFREILGSMDMPSGMTLCITDASGTVYMQDLQAGNLIGRRLDVSEDSVVIGGGTPAAINQDRMISGASKVGHFPLFVTTALPLDEVLEPWRQNAFLYGGLSMILVLVSAGLSIALVRSQIHINRQSRTLALAASTDMLTGVMNRRSFMDAARREYSRVSRYGGGLTCVMIDLDHFKRINDMFGHAAGDVALSACAKFVSARIRDVDLFCRYGGEEFVLLLPGTSLSGARSVAESLRKGLSSLSLEINNKNFSITASFGVAEVDSGIKSVEELLVCADQGLYLAKSDGRNQVRVATDSCDQGAGNA